MLSIQQKKVNYLVQLSKARHLKTLELCGGGVVYYGSC